MMQYMLETHKDKSNQIVLSAAICLGIVFCVALVFRSATTSKDQEDKLIDLSMRIISGLLAVLYLLFLYGVWKQSFYLMKFFYFELILQIIGFFVFLYLGIHWQALLPNLIWSIVCIALVVVYIRELCHHQHHQQQQQQDDEQVNVNA